LFSRNKRVSGGGHFPRTPVSPLAGKWGREPERNRLRENILAALPSRAGPRLQAESRGQDLWGRAGTLEPTWGGQSRDPGGWRKKRYLRPVWAGGPNGVGEGRSYNPKVFREENLDGDGRGRQFFSFPRHEHGRGCGESTREPSVKPSTSGRLNPARHGGNNTFAALTCSGGLVFGGGSLKSTVARPGGGFSIRKCPCRAYFPDFPRRRNKHMGPVPENTGG